MEDNVLLEAIGQMMDKKLKPIQEDISTVKEDLSELKENLAELKGAHEETRSGVNSLLEWADTVSVLVKVP